MSRDTTLKQHTATPAPSQPAAAAAPPPPPPPRCCLEGCDKRAKKRKGGCMCIQHSRARWPLQQCEWTRGQQPCQRLIAKESIKYCTRHQRNSEQQLSTLNAAQQPMCHTRCCRQTRDLTHAFHGLFCPLHVQFMAELRGKLEMAKARDDVEEEVRCRRAEQDWRKVEHRGHMEYTEQLRQLLVTTSIATGER